MCDPGLKTTTRRDDGIDVKTPPLRPRAATSDVPPIAGMPDEIWSWLRESMAVRPLVVARVRAALASGEQASAEDVALAILGGPGRLGASST